MTISKALWTGVTGKPIPLRQSVPRVWFDIRKL